MPEALGMGSLSKPNPANDCAAGVVVVKFLLYKERAEFRPAYLRSLRQFLNALVRGREAEPIQQIVNSAPEFLAAQAWCPASLASNIGRLRSFVRWLERHDIASGDALKRIDPPRVIAKTPTILTVAQARLVREWVIEHRPEAMPFLALAMYCGVRPEEIARIEWNAVDTVRGMIVIDGAASKVHRRRVTPIPACAIPLLTNGGRLPFPLTARVRLCHELRAVLGLRAWPQDVFRHSAASYWVALHDDAGKVATWLGTSVAKLQRNYRQLVHRDEAETFFEASPQVVGIKTNLDDDSCCKWNQDKVTCSQFEGRRA